MQDQYDIIIIGGGPAGLSSALIAGRAGLSALLIDGGAPRNAAAPAMHSYLSRDGILPADFRAISHQELARYKTVQRLDGLVLGLESNGEGMMVSMDTGRSVHGRKVLLAAGLADHLPDIEGVAGQWGRGVHACPFCDGHEHRDEHWGVLLQDVALAEYALFLRNWAGRMTVFVPSAAPSETVALLENDGVAVERRAVVKVIGKDGHSLSGVVLEDGTQVPIESLWLRPRQTQGALVEALGLRLREDGAVWRDDQGETSMANVLAAGDCAAGMAQQAIFAAADGARTTFSIVHAVTSGGRRQI
ncbi:NAD(P)/FAD-dependent oxidoreductase [Caulobacter sp. 73W]|uniref:Thioredoxin reductase n=1 Tax=Caulobacter sp. 73W TaxID=3161137 RepID=A0AB39KSN6_9CAUL